MRIKLIIDDRERAIFPHIKPEFDNHIHYEIKRIDIGDYALVDTNSGAILSIFERKTLEDYSASLKDGRHGNKQKLIALREKTGCKIFYIIEGNPFLDPARLVGRTPYRHIESSIFHLMMRDNINVLYSRDTLHTTQLLCRFVISAYNLLIRGDVIGGVDNSAATYSTPLLEKHDCGQSQRLCQTQSDLNATVKSSTLPAILRSAENTQNTTTSSTNPAETSTNNLTTTSTIDISTTNPPNNIATDTTTNTTTNPPDTQPTNNHDFDELNVRMRRSDRDTLRNMWSCFSGIGYETADVFIPKFKLADIVSNKISREELAEVKYPTGRKLSNSVIGTLLFANLAKGKRRDDVEARILGCIQGLSPARAKLIIEIYSIAELLRMDKAELAEVVIGKNKLGAELVERIHTFMNMSLGG